MSVSNGFMDDTATLLANGDAWSIWQERDTYRLRFNVEAAGEGFVSAPFTGRISRKAGDAACHTLRMAVASKPIMSAAVESMQRHVAENYA